MKSHRVVLNVIALALSGVAFAQDHSDTKKSPAPKSDAQVSFDTLKSLAGTWTGSVMADPPDPRKNNKPIEVTMHVTSSGNALVHEGQEAGTPLDPAKYEHPLTMMYLDGDQLTLTHYCDAGNRPRMAARKSLDGKTVEFDFVDLSGSNQRGHMYHAVFTVIDANHHTEDWTYMLPGDKAIHAHFELKREQ